MSFLRALRAYIGLGPDDEIEDRYLSELNARRRQLELDEIHPDDETVIDLRYADADDLDDRDLDPDDGVAPAVSNGRSQRRDERGDPDDLDGLDDDEHVVIRPRGAGRRRAKARSGPPDHEARSGPSEREARSGPSNHEARSGPSERLAGYEGFDPDDELDMAFIERMEGFGGGRPGRHDIEPDGDLESIVDDGGETVTLRAREHELEHHQEDEDPAEGADAAAFDVVEAPADTTVVRSLDSMRAKPRTLLPESFADAKLVADDFKRDIPVVLNLQSVERDLARRLIDFASGICYVLDGSMEKIASQVFLLIPDSVEVSDEDRRRIEERGYAR